MASVAGLRAIEGARKAGYAGRISLIGAEEYLPYDRPPLSKTYLTDEQPQPTFYRTEEALREQLGVDLFLGRPVEIPPTAPSFSGRDSRSVRVPRVSAQRAHRRSARIVHPPCRSGQGRRDRRSRGTALDPADAQLRRRSRAV